LAPAVKYAAGRISQIGERLTMSKLYDAIAEILEVDEIDPSRPLRDYETWDSLAALSLVASVRTNFGLVISTGELQRVKTAADLEEFVRSKQAPASRR
jgi:acyl carrier protein